MRNAETIKPVTATSSAEAVEVAEAKLRIDGSTVYRIKLPEGTVGWLGLDEDHWDATLAFFASQGAKYEIVNAAMLPMSDGPLMNAACPSDGLTDYRVFFQHWSPAAIRFAADGPRDVLFMVVKDVASSASP